MDAIIKRIGQDLTFVWTINKKDGSQLFLEDKEVSLYMSSPRGRIIFKNLVIKNNQIEWIFYGKDQVSTGDYTATVKISNGNSGVIIIDKSNCLRLVSKTFMEGNENEGIKNGDTILFSSEVNAFQIMPIIPTADEEGNIFADGKLVTDIIPNTLARVNEFLTFASISESERKEAESARKIAESSRVSAESGRVKTEGARQTAESARQTAEAKRQTDTAAAIKNAETATTEANNAAESANTAAGKAEEAARETLLTNEKVNQQESKRVIAEGERGGNEIKRQTAEAGRVKSEESRVLTESSRQKSEQARQQAEESRATAEENRVSAETLRSTAESERKKAEDTRIVSEQVRTAAESARVKAEESRVAAESVRETAEHQRQTDTATAIKNAETATTEANNAAGKANAAANRAEEGANNLGIEDYPEFSAEKSYIVGDVVRYSGRLYRFISAHPAGAWAGTDAEQTSVKEELDRAVAMKANVDGYYETMRVGTADNLTPRGDASEEIIMNRTAGGNNAIESGDASIKSIKGNSVVRNQYVRDHKFETLPSSSVWIDYGGDNQVSNGELTVAITTEYAGISQKISVIKGHKYLFICEAKSPNEASLSVPYLWPEYFPERNLIIATPEFKTYATIQTALQTGSDSVFGVRSSVSAEMGTTYTAKNLSMFDLTQMFGAGNEPATPEEFARRLGYDSIEQLPYIPYNEGEIVSCNAEGIRTTDAEGDTYERKWTSTLQKYFPDGLKSAGPAHDEITSTKAVKRIVSVKMNSLGWVTHNDEFRIFRADIANMAGPANYEDRKNGLLSNVYKPSKTVSIGLEMEDSSILRGVGVIYIKDSRYSDLESFANHFTENDELYYELATPEEYTYDELNLTERVAPGSTEEAIIPEGVLSTPLKIDVVYPIDAYGTIVGNKKNIGNLSSLQTSAKTDLVSAINENNQLAKDAYPTGGYMAELYKAAGAVYNEEKGLWVLNGIELTDEEMAEVYNRKTNSVILCQAFYNTSARTNIPILPFVGANVENGMLNCYMLCRSSKIEIFAFNSAKTGNYTFSIKDLNAAFSKCPNLKEVWGILDVSRCTALSEVFEKSPLFEFIKMKRVKVDVSFKDSPNLLVEDTENSTLSYLVTNAANSDPITVTLHADAYARVPESLKTKAQEKQISIVSA